MQPSIATLQPSTADEADYLDVNAVDYLRVSARSLQRSIDFYVRVFGFEIIRSWRDPRDPRVLLRSPRGDLYMELHQPREEMLGDIVPLARWSFVVRNLDSARETVWNLGVAAAGGSDESRRIQSWRKTRSFVIRDPDGHEIELVEAR